MTKKQYSIRNVTVGTVKKSKAAITFAVIREKGEPLLPGIPAPNHTTQISGRGSFREGKAQLLQFR